MESVHFIKAYIFAVLVVELTGYCLYGDVPDCAFPCHCANKAECTTGCQPTGCATDPLNVTWQGPGCQIGNVALGKMANQTRPDAVWQASNGVDGLLPADIGMEPAVCAFPYVMEGQLPEWGVDLGGIYKISSVIIYNVLSTCCRDRTTMFTIGIRNSSNYEELCYDDNSTSQPDYKISITCNKPVIGRYIHFAGKPGGYQPDVMNFCELIAIGHRYFDCTMLQCDAGTGCSEVTGCEQCMGSYQPDCLAPCADGFYGVNCQSTCGHCAGDDVCHKTAGHCPNDCTTWWAGQDCKEYIFLPEYHNETASVTELGSSFLKLSWQPISIPEQLSLYYGYTVYYKQPGETNYTHGPDVPHTTNPQATITGLVHNTHFQIKIQPYRQINGTKEYGFPYPLMMLRTTCGEPEMPVILNISQHTMSLKDVYNIELTFFPISQLAPRCDSMAKAWIQYKAQIDTLYTDIEIDLDTTAYTIRDVSGGNYDIRITVSNNQGVNSSSLLETISLGEESNGNNLVSQGGGGPDLTVIISSSVVAGIIALTVIVSIVLILKHRRERFHGQTDNSQGPAQVTADLTDVTEAYLTTDLTYETPPDDSVYEIIEEDTIQENNGGGNGQYNTAMELDDTGYTHLQK